MNREEGFPIADIDVGLMHDPKLVALAKRQRDPRRTLACIGMYVAVVLESWSRGDRATLDESAPAWWPDPVDDIAAELAAVGLVDEEGRPAEHAFERWFRPAWDRREKRRASGAEGGRRSWEKRRTTDASAALNPSHSPAVRPAARQAGPAVVASEVAFPEAQRPRCAKCQGPFDDEDDWKASNINAKWVNVHKSCVEGSDGEPLRAELDRIFDQDDAA